MVVLKCRSSVGEASQAVIAGTLWVDRLSRTKVDVKMVVIIWSGIS